MTEPEDTEPTDGWPDPVEEEEPEIVTDDDTIFIDPNESDYDPFGLDKIDETFKPTVVEEVTTPDETVTEESKGGMSKAGIAILLLFILFILIPALLILACFLAVRFYPSSKAGQNLIKRKEMFKEMMEKRKERKLRLAE